MADLNDVRDERALVTGGQNAPRRTRTALFSVPDPAQNIFLSIQLRDADSAGAEIRDGAFPTLRAHCAYRPVDALFAQGLVSAGGDQPLARPARSAVIRIAGSARRADPPARARKTARRWPERDVRLDGAPAGRRRRRYVPAESVPGRRLRPQRAGVRPSCFGGVTLRRRRAARARSPRGRGATHAASRSRSPSLSAASCACFTWTVARDPAEEGRLLLFDRAKGHACLLARKERRGQGARARRDAAKSVSFVVVGNVDGAAAAAGPRRSSAAQKDTGSTEGNRNPFIKDYPELVVASTVLRTRTRTNEDESLRYDEPMRPLIHVTVSACFPR